MRQGGKRRSLPTIGSTLIVNGNVKRLNQGIELGLRLVQAHGRNHEIASAVRRGGGQLPLGVKAVDRFGAICDTNVDPVAG